MGSSSGTPRAGPRPCDPRTRQRELRLSWLCGSLGLSSSLETDGAGIPKTYYYRTKPRPLAGSRHGDAWAGSLRTFRCAAGAGKCGVLRTGSRRARIPEPFLTARIATCSTTLPGVQTRSISGRYGHFSHASRALGSHFRRAPPALAGCHLGPRVAPLAGRHWPHVGWRESSRSMSTVALQNRHWPSPMTSFFEIPRTKLSISSN